jgi:hypothetical protein
MTCSEDMRPGNLFLRLVSMSIFSLISTLFVPRAFEMQEALQTTWSGPPEENPVLMPILLNETRQCTSPERNVTWPLVGTASSVTSRLHCGTLSDSPLADFFGYLATSLKEEYGEECKSWVRFGVAFGGSHVEKLKPFRRAPHKCTFMFVLDDEMPQKHNDTNSFGFETLLPVPRHILPYQSMRRNVKLFKMHGHELFPFAKYLVWQDVKLKGKFFVPSNYYKRFLQDEDHGTPCLAAVGLPPHESAFGNRSHFLGYRPRYQDHCETVVNSIEARPNVTDSVDTLLEQCKTYQSYDLPGSSLNRGLIDSAFIVWNHNSDRCRHFNAKLACTWSDEIQCYSDRDQIAFPYILQRMGLKESTSSKWKNATRNNVLMVDKNDKVLVQILRSQCHWYYQGFPRLCSE